MFYLSYVVRLQIQVSFTFLDIDRNFFGSSKLGRKLFGKALKSSWKGHANTMSKVSLMKKKHADICIRMTVILKIVRL